VKSLIWAIIFATMCALACQSESAGKPIGKADKIVVHKQKRELHLMNGGKTLKIYKVALGGSPVGRKEVEGDQKTPEGVYKITAHNPRSQFYKSLRVSYPNESDRKRAAALKKSPGSDIMIHGLGDNFGFLGKAHRLSDWTLGCIAVTNEEIDEIYASVIDGTQIEILP
jgi:murein L,D-transpeptidase YafK